MSQARKIASLLSIIIAIFAYFYFVSYKNTVLLSKTSIASIQTKVQPVDYEELKMNEENKRIKESSSNFTQTTKIKKLQPINSEEMKTNKSSKQINFLSIPQAMFIHMGKAGGGNIDDQVKNKWRLHVDKIHPKITNGYPKPLLNKQAIWISLRDPVDRFLSAFYWRLIIFCDRKGDKRKISNINAYKYPKEYCRTGWNKSKEYYTLFHHYDRDANNLAAAVCASYNTKNETAIQDIQNIGHVGKGQMITDWIPLKGANSTDNNTKYLKPDINIFPIVLEHPFDLVAQVDDAVEWTYNITHFEELDKFKKRQQMAKAVTHDNPQGNDDDNNSGNTDHSSSTHKKSLTKINEACMTRFYSSEYDELQKIKDKFCHTATCHDAIKSILLRQRNRLSLLD